jgi:hypothetical protein
VHNHEASAVVAMGTMDQHILVVGSWTFTLLLMQESIYL